MQISGSLPKEGPAVRAASLPTPQNGSANESEGKGMNKERRRPEVAATQEAASQRRGSSTSLPPGTLPKIVEAQRAVLRRHPRMHPGTAMRIALKATGALAIVAAMSGCVTPPNESWTQGKARFCVDNKAVRPGDRIRYEDGRVLVVTRVVGQAPFTCRWQPSGRDLGVEGELV